MEDRSGNINMKTHTFEEKIFKHLIKKYKGRIFWRINNGIHYIKGPSKLMDRLNSIYN